MKYLMDRAIYMRNYLRHHFPTKIVEIVGYEGNVSIKVHVGGYSQMYIMIPIEEMIWVGIHPSYYEEAMLRDVREEIQKYVKQEEEFERDFKAGKFP